MPKRSNVLEAARIRPSGEGGMDADRAAETIEANVRTASRPSELRITDMRVAEIALAIEPVVPDRTAAIETPTHRRRNS